MCSEYWPGLCISSHDYVCLKSGENIFNDFKVLERLDNDIKTYKDALFHKNVGRDMDHVNSTCQMTFYICTKVYEDICNGFRINRANIISVFKFQTA